MRSLITIIFETKIGFLTVEIFRDKQRASYVALVDRDRPTVFNLTGESLIDITLSAVEMAYTDFKVVKKR